MAAYTTSSWGHPGQQTQLQNLNGENGKGLFLAHMALSSEGERAAILTLLLGPGPCLVTTLKMLIIWSSRKEDWWILQRQPHVLLWKGHMAHWTELDPTRLSGSQEDQFYSRSGQGQKCSA